MNKFSIWAGVLAIAGILVIGCGSPLPTEPGVDGGRDAGRDAQAIDASGDDASVEDAAVEDDADVDADVDASMDDGSVPEDDGGVIELDGGSVEEDAGIDGGTTVEIDGGTTVEIDGGTTVEIDGGTIEPDGGPVVVDAGTDAGGPDGGPLCGNGALDPGEDCDAALLGGETCSTQGFTAGTLSCGADCAFVTSACTTCGDGMGEGAEACDGSDLRGATCISRGFASGSLSCGTGCAIDEGACSSAATPSAIGQLVVSEIFQNPAAPFSDPNGEWFELRNTTATPLNLFGCVFTDAGSSMFVVSANVVVPANGFATFAATTSVAGAPGFTPSYSYPASYVLANTSDTIALTCGGTPIDSVAYDGTFPSPNGASMTLDPDYLSATANDTGANWCLGRTVYDGGSHLGTPGAANETCSLPVGFCRLQSPPTIMATAGTSTLVYGRVYVAGLSDLPGGMTDTDFRVRAAVGYGPDGSTPSASWTWTAATANGTYAPGSPGHEPNNDEYQASLVAPAAGTYDYAYRFSGDGGRTWLYCDLDGATTAAEYSAAQAGAMTTTASTATPPSLYFSEYLEGSSNNKALEIFNAGTAPVDLAAAMCRVRIFANGSATGSSPIPLTGTVAPGGTRVLCHSSSNAAILALCQVTSGSLSFNGDDAVQLECDTTPLDIIGQIGTDPGAEWGTGMTSTFDHTQRRLCSVTTGDVNGADAFDPATQWTGFAVDTSDGLGMRACPTTP